MASETIDGGGVGEQRNLSQRVNIDTISVGGRVYVAGLYWHSLEKLKEFKREARDFGQREGMDVVTFRHTPNGIQAGFAPRTHEAKLLDTYSLAAALAQRLGDDWLALFEIDAEADRYAFAAAKDGDILTNQDIIGDRATVEKRFKRQWAKVAGDAEGTDGWGRVIVPESFGFDGERLTLQELLDPKLIKKTARLRPLKPWEITFTRGQKVGLVAGLLSIPALVIGGIYLNDYLKVRAAQEEARLHPPKPPQQVKVQTVLKKPPIPLPHPWAQELGSQAVITACTEQIWSVPLSVGGRRLASVTCRPGQLVATYQRPPSEGSFIAKATIAEFQAAAAAYFHVTLPITSDLGDATSVSLGLQIPGAPTDEALRPLTSVMVDFPSHWQAWGINPGLQIIPDPTPPKDENTYLPPTWTAYSFEVSSGFNAPTLFAAVEPTGLRVTEVDLGVQWPSVENSDSSNGSDKTTSDNNILTWKIKGEIYATR